MTAENARLRAELDTAREVSRVRRGIVCAPGEARSASIAEIIEERAVRKIDTALDELAPLTGVRAACACDRNERCVVLPRQGVQTIDHDGSRTPEED